MCDGRDRKNKLTTKSILILIGGARKKYVNNNSNSNIQMRCTHYVKKTRWLFQFERGEKNTSKPGWNEYRFLEKTKQTGITRVGFCFVRYYARALLCMCFAFKDNSAVTA